MVWMRDVCYCHFMFYLIIHSKFWNIQKRQREVKFLYESNQSLHTVVELIAGCFFKACLQWIQWNEDAFGQKSCTDEKTVSYDSNKLASRKLPLQISPLTNATLHWICLGDLPETVECLAFRKLPLSTVVPIRKLISRNDFIADVSFWDIATWLCSIKNL